MAESWPPCPTCGGVVVTIAYGYPSEEMLAALGRGEIELGGCCISPDLPTWRCRDCGHSGGRLDHPDTLDNETRATDRTADSESREAGR